MRALVVVVIAVVVLVPISILVLEGYAPFHLSRAAVQSEDQ